jgi:small subunit ribosomal protein S2
MAEVTMSQLLNAGVHFGHQTRRWNPKMKQYILMERNGIHIINLFKTLDLIDKAYDFVKQTVAHNGNILFVGTKKQAAEAISEQATRVGMPYVSERWLGGMLTNFQTVSKRVARMKELEEMDFDDVRGSGLTKKELLLLRREKEKLVRQLGGIRNMNRTPSALFIVDINKEALAVEEAHKLGIPVVALVDTNTDPEVVDYPIPANDDAIRGIALLTTLMADAVADGLLERSNKSSKNEAKEGEQKPADQPLAEWETELLKKDDAPAAEAAKAEAAPKAEEKSEAKAE